MYEEFTWLKWPNWLVGIALLSTIASFSFTDSNTIIFYIIKIIKILSVITMTIICLFKSVTAEKETDKNKADNLIKESHSALELLVAFYLFYFIFNEIPYILN